MRHGFVFALLTSFLASACSSELPVYIDQDPEPVVCKYNGALVDTWWQRGWSLAFDGQTTWGKDQINHNCLELGIKLESNRADAEAALRDAGIPLDAVYIRVTGPVCQAYQAPNVVVTVLDSVTNAPAAIGATGTATATTLGGTYFNTLRVVGDSQMVDGLLEYWGTFTIRINKTGYKEWLRNDIVVGHDECHVITARVTARLVPL